MKWRGTGCLTTGWPMSVVLVYSEERRCASNHPNISFASGQVDDPLLALQSLSITLISVIHLVSVTRAYGDLTVWIRGAAADVSPSVFIVFTLLAAVLKVKLGLCL